MIGWIAMRCGWPWDNKEYIVSSLRQLKVSMRKVSVPLESREQKVSDFK